MPEFYKSENISFSYDADLKIFMKKHIGDVSMQDIKDSWQWAFENNIIPKGTTRFLLDYRDAIILDTVKSSNSIMEYYKENLKYFENTKIAIVSEEPKNVALSILISKNDYSYESRPFSSFENAIDWLRL